MNSFLPEATASANSRALALIAQMSLGAKRDLMPHRAACGLVVMPSGSVILDGLSVDRFQAARELSKRLLP